MRSAFSVEHSEPISKAKSSEKFFSTIAHGVKAGKQSPAFRQDAAKLKQYNKAGLRKLNRSRGVYQGAVNEFKQGSLGGKQQQYVLDNRASWREARGR